MANLQCTITSWSPGEAVVSNSDGQYVGPCDDEHLHSLRVHVRKLLFAKIKNRNDIEGCDNVDFEASSAGPWKSFRKVLSPVESALVNIFRAGAVSTPTRRGNLEKTTKCLWCDCQHASMHHFFTSCPRFDNERYYLSHLFGFDMSWFSRQPRITTKSGWIILSAHNCSEMRSTPQVAAAKLAIVIMGQHKAGKHG